jgi:hypothetical protein
MCWCGLSIIRGMQNAGKKLLAVQLSICKNCEATPANPYFQQFCSLSIIGEVNFFWKGNKNLTYAIKLFQVCSMFCGAAT